MVIRDIHFWYDLQCCHELGTFSSKRTQPLNELLLKPIHLRCHLWYCQELHTFTSKKIQPLNELLINIFISYSTFSSVMGWLHSLRSNLNCWMDSSYKLFIFEAIFNVLTIYTRSLRSELLLIRLLVKIIYFWCHLQCCHKLHIFTAK